jgi:hypothetical protein
VGWAMAVSRRTACRYIKLGRELEAQRRARAAAEIRSSHLIGQQVRKWPVLCSVLRTRLRGGN